jgi:3D-(3,5/4)-trihydroxycyclohexane-1,2-dione acylhydrolase (decyclizing)
MLTGEKLPIDLAANVEALGAEVVRVNLLDEFRAAIATARAAAFHHHIEIDPPARTAHQVHERDQKPLIGGVQP